MIFLTVSEKGSEGNVTLGVVTNDVFTLFIVIKEIANIDYALSVVQKYFNWLEIDFTIESANYHEHNSRYIIRRFNFVLSRIVISSDVLFYRILQLFIMSEQKFETLALHVSIL